jgi:uncharacterized protein
MELSPAEARVLGCLIEKDMTTPEYYPLSLNAIVNACNQKSNREPVVSYDDTTAREALDDLRNRGWAVFVHETGSRVEKYRHALSERFNFTRGETAVLGVLLLRGPQTAAELRDRTQRMHSFDDPDAVTYALEKLAARQPDPLTVLLPRQPGQKEQRWAHLLCGAPDLSSSPSSSEAAPRPDRLATLEAEVAGLRAEVDRLRADLAAFKAQF